MLKTDTDYVPHIVPGERYIYWCDHLELMGTDKETERIIRMHNAGYDLFDIAERNRRHPFEVANALFHQATVSNWSNNRIKDRVARPILYRKSGFMK